MMVFQNLIDSRLSHMKKCIFRNFTVQTQVYGPSYNFDRIKI